MSEHRGEVFFPADADWRCSCGHYVLRREGHICQAIRQADFNERLVLATERIAAALEAAGPSKTAPSSEVEASKELK